MSKTIKEHLNDINSKEYTTLKDENILKAILDQIKFPYLKITCGIIYFDNKGKNFPIKQFIEILLQQIKIKEDQIKC